MVSGYTKQVLLTVSSFVVMMMMKKNIDKNRFNEIVIIVFND